MIVAAARKRCFVILILGIGLMLGFPADRVSSESRQESTPANWFENLEPIGPEDWNPARAAQLLERAGFGATPDETLRFSRMTPREAVLHLVEFEKIESPGSKAFDASNIHDPGLEPFPPSRPATTALAKQNGEALGIKVKPSGNRPLQPIVNKFFYWLRASMLETDRLAYWWGNRMLTSNRPLQEKMALFWHGHFATSETKVRDARKMQKQLEVFHRYGAGQFRDLLIAVAQDPAMLHFLDAGVNVKGAPNENFAREIMELFTMGEGNYSETDIREAARAFTGWNYSDLTFVINSEDHDEAEKTIFGQTGNFDGVEVIDLILGQPATADYLASKLYRYFVRQDPSPSFQKRLGAILRNNDYEIGAFLYTIFLSKDFYSNASAGTHIKSPVQLVISTYRKLGLSEIPGIPDFNETTGALGQRLFHPPTVAGWAHGRSWITPGLLLERGNFVRNVVYPDISFVAHDRRPPPAFYESIQAVNSRITEGWDITAATSADIETIDGTGDMDDMMDMGSPQMIAESNRMADRDEAFNTRYGSYRGWQMAIQRVKPIPRFTAQLDLSAMVYANELQTTDQVVDYFIERFLLVPVNSGERQMLIEFLNQDLGTQNIRAADTYLEDSLRLLIHLIMSTPEYQLG